MLQSHESLVEEHLISDTFDKHSYNNIPPHIWALTKRRIWENPAHPIAILLGKIREYFDQEKVGVVDIPGEKFEYFDGMSPLVSTENCFDKLLVPKNHISRSPKDTYYQDEHTVLRPHTSAHQVEHIKEHDSFLAFGDVYRRDSIDATHYPGFH